MTCMIASNHIGNYKIKQQIDWLLWVLKPQAVLARVKERGRGRAPSPSVAAALAGKRRPRWRRPARWPDRVARSRGSLPRPPAAPRDAASAGAPAAGSPPRQRRRPHSSCRVQDEEGGAGRRPLQPPCSATKCSCGQRGGWATSQSTESSAPPPDSPAASPLLGNIPGLPPPPACPLARGATCRRGAGPPAAGPASS